MEDREIRQLEDEWSARFGERLPMRTEPELIRRILNEMFPASAGGGEQAA